VGYIYEYIWDLAREMEEREGGTEGGKEGQLPSLPLGPCW